MRLPRQFGKKQIDETDERGWETIQDLIQTQMQEEVKVSQEKDGDELAILAKLMTLKDNLMKALC